MLPMLRILVWSCSAVDHRSAIKAALILHTLCPDSVQSDFAALQVILLTWHLHARTWLTMAGRSHTCTCVCAVMEIEPIDCYGCTHRVVLLP